jgi:hypothetical protein
VIGMYYHMFPAVGEQQAACSCSLHQHGLVNARAV